MHGNLLSVPHADFLRQAEGLAEQLVRCETNFAFPRLSKGYKHLRLQIHGLYTQLVFLHPRRGAGGTQRPLGVLPAAEGVWGFQHSPPIDKAWQAEVGEAGEVGRLGSGKVGRCERLGRLQR